MNYKLTDGDVIALVAGHKVYANVPKHFVYSNAKGDFSLVKTDVTLGGDFDYLIGRYIVTSTSFTGGGTGHGPHDVYPNGHLVKCSSVDGLHEVSFYQSGCFTAMIEDIKPIGKAKVNWVLDGTDLPLPLKQ